MTLRLHIEQLVLHSFDPHDRYAIADAFQQELSRLLAAEILNPEFSAALRQHSNNSRLDADGFAPFGQVIAGMDVVDKLFSPDAQPDQRRLLREGNGYLQKEFPQLDFVKKASILPAASGPARRRPS